MSGLVSSGRRRGADIYVSLWSRGGWPTAERSARSLLRDGETLIRLSAATGEYHFRACVG